jgi:hypothetical protein
MAAASPSDKAILDGLSERLKLEGPNRAQQARGISQAIDQRRRTLDEKRQKLQQAHNQIRRALQTRVKTRWPELGNLLRPSAAKVLADEGDAIVKYLEAAPRFKEFEDENDQISAIDEDSDQAERTWVKAQRFLRECETVALEANLPRIANETVQRKYMEMQTAEGAGFVGWR